MRSLISALILVSLLPIQCFADCDWSKDISPEADGSYKYSRDCNKRVGKLVQDNKDLNDEVDKLNKTIDLKDLTIQTDEKRADLWMNSSLKLEDRVNTIDKMNETNKWLYFGLGIVVSGFAVWGASRLVK